MAIVPSDIPIGALTVAREAAEAAGRMAIAYFRHGSPTTAGIDYKHGGSPVTEADLLVDAFLRERLMNAAPDFGWLSEETADAPARLNKRHVWVVDPIDGTKSFARGDPDWTIAVGLVRDGAPLAGFVYAPVTDEMFEAIPGRPALLNGHPIAVSRRAALAGARIAGPRPVLDALHASGAGIERAARIHSLALRIVRVADGTLDGGVAANGPHDWDLAAAHAILMAAGGVMLTAEGETPLYNRRSTRHDAVAMAGPELVEPLAAALGRRERSRS
ncbi:3'(2'),5'-bisphosphate nucleotidase CysQ [Alsobacter sp. SYSU M60028]|uniref:3'(2'),5'-bisphosphate nucleotidase CysQ n=1 Tax=Alsobacter ponti TaxID=2962936 RepID=A0ABT1LE71_9HYPH|nr:3'(2'),5'-bisphosphate nucleotidase CysQ [Alsobacter ponti]MCP8939216.1 3'(2'),5'-bisphosphate nucleotidase CysQ [Alsobacter ponti]